MQCKYRDKLHLLILWKTYEAKSIVQYNRLITLQHGHSRRVRRMKNGGVQRRLTGSLLEPARFICAEQSALFFHGRAELDAAGFIRAEENDKRAQS